MASIRQTTNTWAVGSININTLTIQPQLTRRDPETSGLNFAHSTIWRELSELSTTNSNILSSFQRNVNVAVRL